MVWVVGGVDCWFGLWSAPWHEKARRGAVAGGLGNFAMVKFFVAGLAWRWQYLAKRGILWNARSLRVLADEAGPLVAVWCVVPGLLSPIIRLVVVHPLIPTRR